MHESILAAGHLVFLGLLVLEIEICKCLFSELGWRGVDISSRGCQGVCALLSRCLWRALLPHVPLQSTSLQLLSGLFTNSDPPAAISS